MSRRYHTIIAVLVLIFSIVLLNGCDMINDLKEIDPDADWFLWGKTRKITAEKKAKTKFNAKLLKVYRGDLLILGIDGQTQVVHLMNIVSPSPDNFTFNKKLAKRIKCNTRALSKIGKKAANTATGLLAGTNLVWVTLHTSTNKAGEVSMHGDVYYGGARSLSRILLMDGLAVVMETTPKYLSLYKSIENDTMLREVGIWKHPTPLAKRFFVNCRFTLDSSIVDRSNVYGGDGKSRHKLETHKLMEKRGSVSIDIQAQKPFIHPYEGELRYRFHFKEEHGENQTTDLGVKTKQLIRSPLYLDDYQTNITLLSQVAVYTESTKGGRSYSHGKMFVGYDLEVWIGTNRVYYHYHNN